MKEKAVYFLSSLVSLYIKLTRRPSKVVKRILVIKSDEIGDMVTALHVFKHLNAGYPEAQIDLFCQSYNRIFFKYISYINCMEKLDHSVDYEIIADLRGDIDSLVYAFKSNAAQRVDRGTIRLRNKLSGGQKNELLTNYEIIAPLVSSTFEEFDQSISWSSIEERKIESSLALLNIKEYVVLHLGARDAARRWPIERYAEIIDHIYDVYGLQCILAGGTDDLARNDECILLCKSTPLNFAGKFDLLEFTVLCSHSSLFIGNESGPLHIASACSIPVIALFGPGVKDVFYPLGKHVRIHHYFLEKRHKEQTIQNSTIFYITIEEIKSSIRELIHHD